MRLTHTTSQDNLIWHWRSGGLLNVVGYGYVRQFLWEWLLLIVGNCFVMGLRESTITNQSVSENYRKDLLKIASTITSHLIVGPQQRTYLSLMKSMMNLQCLLAVHLNFLLLFLPPLLSALFRTWLKAVRHIFPKKKKPSWDEDIPGLLEVTFQGSCLTERYAYNEAFGFATDVVVSTIKGCTIVNMLIVTVLQCIMTHSFVSLDMFVVCIVCYNDDSQG